MSEGLRASHAPPPLVELMDVVDMLLKPVSLLWCSGLTTISIFSSLLFVQKSLICLVDKSMTPHRGKALLLGTLRLEPLRGFMS